MTKIIFPNCGISYTDVLEVAVTAHNKRHAAKKLGICERQFCQVIKDLGMGHWFKLKKPRPKCVSREDIIQVASEGYPRRDAAFILGISLSYLKDLICEYKIADAFTVKSGKAAWITRTGYVK